VTSPSFSVSSLGPPTHVSSAAFNQVVTLAQEHKNSSFRVAGQNITPAYTTYSTPKGSANPRQAFDEVLPVAQDYASKTGYLKAADYTKIGNRGGKATHTRNTFKQAPTGTDFICDVEITARRTLSTSELTYFKKYYMDECLAIADPNDYRDVYMGVDKYFLEHLLRFPESERESIAAMDHGIRLKLGAKFIEVGLHPCTNVHEGYFSDADIRIKREKNG
jgi:hypothetical protein